MLSINFIKPQYYFALADNADNAITAYVSYNQL